MLRNITSKSTYNFHVGFEFFLLFLHLIYAQVEQHNDITHIVFVNHISKINLLKRITFHLQFVYYLRVISTLKFKCQNTTCIYMNFRKLFYCCLNSKQIESNRQTRYDVCIHFHIAQTLWKVQTFLYWYIYVLQKKKGLHGQQCSCVIEALTDTTVDWVLCYNDPFHHRLPYLSSKTFPFLS